MTLAVGVRHSVWGAIGLPIWSWLDVRQGDVEKLPEEAQWTFQTKRVQAAEWVLRAARPIQAAGKRVGVVADGASAKQPFVRPLREQDLTRVGRLRKDAALYDRPPVVKHPGRGRPRKYGVNRLSLAKRAAHPQGWSEVTGSVNGPEVIKTVKTFLATHETFGGPVRMVIIPEDHGPQFPTRVGNDRTCHPGFVDADAASEPPLVVRGRDPFPPACRTSRPSPRVPARVARGPRGIFRPMNQTSDFLRIVWFRRSCGMDSGETNSGLPNDHFSNNRPRVYRRSFRGSRSCVRPNRRYSGSELPNPRSGTTKVTKHTKRKTEERHPTASQNGCDTPLPETFTVTTPCLFVYFVPFVVGFLCVWWAKPLPTNGTHTLHAT